MKSEDLQLLIHSLLGPLRSEDEEKLQKLLQNDPELKVEQQRLLKLRQALSTISAPFDPEFTFQVMQQLPLTLLHQLRQRVVPLFPMLAAASVAALLAFLGAVYWTEGLLDINTILGFESLTPAEAEYVINR